MKVWWVKNRKGKPFSVRRFKKYGMWSDFDGTYPETFEECNWYFSILNRLKVGDPIWNYFTKTWETIVAIDIQWISFYALTQKRIHQMYSCPSVEDDAKWLKSVRAGQVVNRFCITTNTHMYLRDFCCERYPESRTGDNADTYKRWCDIVVGITLPRGYTDDYRLCG